MDGRDVSRTHLAMQLLGGRLVHSASDLNAYSECLHLTALTRLVAEGKLEKPVRDDPTAELLAKKGDEHERTHLERLRAVHGERLVAFEGRPPSSLAGYEAAERESVAAMAVGAEVIYQPTFFDGTFLGRADFLRRVPGASRFGDWRYAVIDTKLALSPKPYFLVQLCNYAEHLDRVQGAAANERAAIVLGSGVEQWFRIDDYAAYYRRLKAAYLASVARGDDAYPYACAHCELCPWRDACERRRDRDDHLGIVANIRRDQIGHLIAGEIPTLAALARATDAQRPRRPRAQTFETLREQAAEQHRHRSARDERGYAPHSYRFREAGVPTAEKELATYGFARLPAPAPGDVFFDMEGDPMYRPGRALEYLFGVYVPDEDRYMPFWGRDESEERLAFEAFVDFVVARRARHPELHVYHYAPYEPTSLKRLMGRFGSREREIDDLLRAGTLVDLYPIVRQSIVVSQPSYSIKKLEALYGFTRTLGTKTKGGDDSIVMFESWLESHDDALLEDIRAYNEDDCRSTHALRDWLVRLRAERNAQLATPIPWRAAIASERKDDAAGEPHDALAARLLDGIAAPASLAELREMWPADRERWLAGNLVAYHRREQKPAWWEFFHRVDNAAELVDDDRKAIGGLTYDREVAPYPLTPSPKKKLLVHGYRYPDQEHDLAVGDKVVDELGRRAGVVVALDDDARAIHVELPGNIDAADVRAFSPSGPLDVSAQRAAIAYVAERVEARTLEVEHPATATMLAAGAPRLVDRPAGSRIQPAETSAAALSGIVAALDRSCLVVQGPPGSGKSTYGAAVVLDLLAAGKTVALAAQSHKALHGLLRKIEEGAAERDVAYRGCHRSSKGDDAKRYRPVGDPSWIAHASSAKDYDDCNLVSSTVYSWADASQRDKFDVVVIDEAGQVSLADALVVSLVAKNVVLLGDPQQLPQVGQGTHPAGVERSILEHLLDERATIPPDRGVFLDVTYRMHPAIDCFVSEAFYDGRLAAAPRTAGNRIDAAGALHGSGLRWLPVEHDGRARRSPEEAEAIAGAIATLLRGGRVAVGGDADRALEPRDVLVVAPYNRQRREIDDRLRALGIEGVAVGTVDKFQGQQAPVVFFSLATSSAELAPRGLEFLLSPNRFNVAISRAQALAVVVGSPRLAESRATSIEAMRLTNLLCRYIEAAQPVAVAPRETATAM